MSTETTTDRAAWLANRRKSIGASEVACVLGQDPYKSPYQLWAEKCGVVEPDDLSDNEAVKWGNRLQDVIAFGYAEETGRDVEPHDQSVSIPGEPPLTATPDNWQTKPGDDDEGVLEIKAPGSRMASQWDGGAPLHYQIQLQSQLAATGCKWGTIAALIDRKLVWFDYDRNPTFIGAMMVKLKEFWRCVELKVPPAIDGSDSAAEILFKLHPNDTGATVDLPPESVLWDRQLRRAKDHIKRCESIIQLRENQIKQALGDATFGNLPGKGRYSWRTQSRAGYTIETSNCRVLRRVK